MDTFGPGTVIDLLGISGLHLKREIDQMTRRRRGSINRFIRSIKGKPNRFLQVQRRIRRERKGKLPTSMYGSSVILTKEQWKKVVEKYNSRELLESLDKLEEKVRLTEAGVKVPPNYLVLETLEDLPRFEKWLEQTGVGFAMKPASGHGGLGIKVIKNKVAGRFISISGKGLEQKYLIRHAENILIGKYTRNEPDRVMVEKKLDLHPSLRELMTPGLPDIRVVVLKGFPLMAMTRLPTRRSMGRANIHQGAIGAGISISEGKITSATLLRKNVKRHPTSGRQIVGFRFNIWEEILEVASLAGDSSGLGFVGVDITLDKEMGVVVLEVNKRPGLEIQNANGAGIKKRIKWVERSIKKSKGELISLGPGIKGELSRKWDSSNWEPTLEDSIEE
jgi:alpha-L-glutamate ligase-like protein